MNSKYLLKLYLVISGGVFLLVAIFHLSKVPAEYPAACGGNESRLFPLPGEGKLKMGWGQETKKTDTIRS